MLAELQRCMSTSQDILNLLSRMPHSSAPTPRPYASADVMAIVHEGIPFVAVSTVPKDTAVKLHQATQTHFKTACTTLLNTPRSPNMPSLKTVLMDLKATFCRLYRRKLDEVTSKSAARRFVATEKQPFSTDVLLYAFEQTQTPNKRERQQLAALTGLTLEQVRVWFQNRRQRMKKRAPELQPRTTLQLTDVLARVAAFRKAAEEDFDDDDSGYFSESDRDRSATPLHPRGTTSLTVSSATSRSYPAPYVPQALSVEFHCDPPIFHRAAAKYAPAHGETTSVSELGRLMSRLTLRHRRPTPCSSTGSASSACVTKATKSVAQNSKAIPRTTKPVPSHGDAVTSKKSASKDSQTGRKVAGRAAVTASPTLPSSASLPPALSPSDPTLSSSVDTSVKPRKRAGPLRRKPAGKALARQASGSSVASSSSSDSSRSTSYSSDFSLASDSSFTSVESVPTAASMECFQPQQQLQFDPLAAFDSTQLFSSQPSDPLPQPVADFELPPDLLAGLQMPMDTAALPPPESTDFLALLNDPTIQDLLQSVQDMDVVAPQQAEQSFTFDNSLDVGTVDTSAFLDVSASTLPTFDAMFGLDASSFQDTLWNSPGFSLPITA